jgi:hypothetical protein
MGLNLFSTASRPDLGSAQPPIHWVQGTLTVGLKRSGSEADHSPPSSTEVRNVWSYTFTLPTRLSGAMLHLTMDISSWHGT